MVAWRLPIRTLAPLAAALALAACAAGQGELPGSAGNAGAAAAPAGAGPDRPVPPGAKPAVPGDFEAARTRPSRRVAPPLPPSRPAFPRVQPAAVPGMALDRALSLFGKPDAVDRGAEVTTWTYRSGYCRLEIDFHFSVADNAMRAHAYRIAGGPDGRDAPARPRLCLHTLAKRSPSLADSRGG